MSDAPPKDTPRLLVEQIASPLRREKSQRATLVGLGLNKLHRKRRVADTPAHRGMIVKVAHLLRVHEEEGK